MAKQRRNERARGVISRRECKQRDARAHEKSPDQGPGFFIFDRQ